MCDTCGNLTSVSSSITVHCQKLAPPRDILLLIYKLREMENIVQPTKEQVTLVLAYHKEKLPNASVSISQMEQFFENNKSMDRNDVDAPFVCHFECSQPRTPNEAKFFRLFYSTPRLLTHANESKIIHADDSYKITVQDYPILPVGISDCDKHFHLCGIAITSGETTEDFRF